MVRILGAAQTTATGTCWWNNRSNTLIWMEFRQTFHVHFFRGWKKLQIGRRIWGRVHPRHSATEWVVEWSRLVHTRRDEDPAIKRFTWPRMWLHCAGRKVIHLRRDLFAFHAAVSVVQCTISSPDSSIEGDKKDHHHQYLLNNGCATTWSSLRGIDRRMRPLTVALRTRIFTQKAKWKSNYYSTAPPSLFGHKDFLIGNWNTFFGTRRITIRKIRRRNQSAILLVRNFNMRVIWLHTWRSLRKISKDQLNLVDDSRNLSQCKSIRGRCNKKIKIGMNKRNVDTAEFFDWMQPRQIEFGPESDVTEYFYKNTLATYCGVEKEERDARLRNARHVNISGSGYFGRWWPSFTKDLPLSFCPFSSFSVRQSHEASVADVPPPQCILDGRQINRPD